MVLEEELKYYNEHKPELLKHYENLFVLIHGSELCGVYGRDEDAYRAGLEKFGNVPMMIRKVVKEEPVVRIPAYTLGLLGGQ